MNDQNLTQNVPLSFTQRTRLAIDCLPVVFFTMALILVVAFWGQLSGGPNSIYFILFLGLVILVTGWTAINRLRDLASGVALVREDLLERSWRSGGSAGPKPFNGKFEQLGRMRLSPKAYGQGQNGFRYRVCYSPASKIVWWLEKPR